MFKYIEQCELFEKICRRYNTINFRDRECFDDAVKKFAPVHGCAGSRVDLVVTRKQHHLAIVRHGLVWPAARKQSIRNGLGTPHPVRDDARPARGM